MDTLNVVFARQVFSAVAAIVADMLIPGGRETLEKTGLLKSTKSSLDDRILKIEAARANLSEALEAIDELKGEAQRNQAALAELRRTLVQREEEKGQLDAKLSELRALTEISASTVQDVFRVPTRASIWAERVIGFVIGVAASVAASFVYSAFV
ncbi:hypothetical protein FY036_02935 [Mesorhizobium microcysteis]|uniref:DUF1640 domain-containing protein n=1 Tax=Neoaquamicrobium microcysteis TaxID=2682781 RepID=A0A5D4H722_9HYPH|nr:hypothetical protein [Mesorhizobium microcysteis]TYR35245.1 hypothetical protein FY036_02935 [Mesorhizobium microcysteis]